VKCQDGNFVTCGAACPPVRRMPSLQNPDINTNHAGHRGDMKNSDTTKIHAGVKRCPKASLIYYDSNQS
jgi:hypothetical protein